MDKRKQENIRSTDGNIFFILTEDTDLIPTATLDLATKDAEVLIKTRKGQFKVFGDGTIKVL